MPTISGKFVHDTWNPIESTVFAGTARRPRRARRGVLMLLLCIAAASVYAGAAAAGETDVSGTAVGVTVAQGNGTVRLVGTYADPAKPGVAGVYNGTYVLDTTGYTSCPLVGTASFTCLPAMYVCNLIHGEITFTSQQGSVTLPIGRDAGGHLSSAVCLDGTDPQVHHFKLYSYEHAFVTPFSARGYGDFSDARLFADGTSVPNGGVYKDSFTFEFGLFQM